MKNDREFMKKCIKLSKKSLDFGELPFASLIVKDNQIIAQSGNKVQKAKDVTRHAEIVVMQKAQKILNTADLSECVIYSSTEPCPMCAFMIRELKFKKVVFGVISPIMGGYSRFKILQDTQLETLKKVYSKPPL